MMLSIGDYLRQLRGEMTFREAAERSGLSHSYIRYLEMGKRPGTNTPISPTPETLKSLSKAYNHSYDDLMTRAGYADEENKKENAEAPPKSKLDLTVEMIERDLNVSISDDPDIMKALEIYLRTLGKIKIKDK